MSSNLGKYIILLGILIVIGGIIISFFGDKLHWIGRLPGDIRVVRPNFQIYFPLTTMILVSLMLTVLVFIIKKFL